MFNIVEVLGTSWGVGNLIYDYLTGAAWWAWLIVGCSLAIAGLFCVDLLIIKNRDNKGWKYFFSHWVNNDT